MSTAILIVTAATAGYLASIYSWPWLRQALVGIENEIDDLRRKLRALEKKIRG